MIDSIKTASVWVMVGFSAMPTLDDAYKLLQVLALLAALVLSVQQIVIRARRQSRERKLVEMVHDAHQQCEKAQEGKCPLRRELERLEKLT